MFYCYAECRIFYCYAECHIFYFYALCRYSECCGACNNKARVFVTIKKQSNIFWKAYSLRVEYGRVFHWPELEMLN